MCLPEYERSDAELQGNVPRTGGSARLRRRSYHHGDHPIRRQLVGIHHVRHRSLTADYEHGNHGRSPATLEDAPDHVVGTGGSKQLAPGQTRVPHPRKVQSDDLRARGIKRMMQVSVIGWEKILRCNERVVVVEAVIQKEPDPG